MHSKLFILFVLIITQIAFSAEAAAGEFRDRLRERLQQRSEGTEQTESNARFDARGLVDLGGEREMSCQEWARKVNRLQRRASRNNPGPTPDLRDVSYGSEKLEKLDVFFSGKKSDTPAPIIMMVHGGGWCVGDKGGASMTEHKVARWVPKGFLFISINYPMVNDGSNALAQANFVAKAVAFVQANAQKWGGDPARIILMGHSAGAHLVSLVNADKTIRQTNAVRPLLGTISLDAGALDVVKQMPNVYPFLKTRYQEAFGNTEAEWIIASPYHKLDASAGPWLGVCSTTRKDDPCGQANAYAEKSRGLGIKASVLPENKNHGAINEELGLPGRYTVDVEMFMASLDPAIATLLRAR